MIWKDDPVKKDLSENAVEGWLLYKSEKHERPAGRIVAVKTGLLKRVYWIVGNTDSNLDWREEERLVQEKYDKEEAMAFIIYQNSLNTNKNETEELD